MKIFGIVIFICFLITVLFCIYLLLKRERSLFKTRYFRMKNILSHQKQTKSLPLYQAFQVIFQKQPNVEKAAHVSHANLLFFESFNTIDFEMHQLRESERWPKNIHYIYGIKGTDDLVSKSRFAFFILQGSRFSQDALSIIPKSYILSIDSHEQEFCDDLKQEGTLFILKKNVQRQQGFRLISSLREYKDIQGAQDDKTIKYIVAQKVLMTPYLVNGHKINIRVYLLVHVKPSSIDWWIYNDGFLYYAPHKFDENDINTHNLITSGYIDRKIYKENPMTIQSLGHAYPEDTKHIMDNTRQLFKKLYGIYAPYLQKENVGIPGQQFCLFGCDIAPCADLSVRIMEINKGPDLSFKDKEDGKLKLDMVHDMLNIVGICDERSGKNGFLRIP